MDLGGAGSWVDQHVGISVTGCMILCADVTYQHGGTYVGFGAGPAAFGGVQANYYSHPLDEWSNDSINASGAAGYGGGCGMDVKDYRNYYCGAGLGIGPFDGAGGGIYGMHSRKISDWIDLWNEFTQQPASAADCVPPGIEEPAG